MQYFTGKRDMRAASQRTQLQFVIRSSQPASCNTDNIDRVAANASESRQCKVSSSSSSSRRRRRGRVVGWQKSDRQIEKERARATTSSAGDVRKSNHNGKKENNNSLISKFAACPSSIFATRFSSVCFFQFEPEQHFLANTRHDHLPIK